HIVRVQQARFVHMYGCYRRRFADSPYRTLGIVAFFEEDVTTRLRKMSPIGSSFTILKTAIVGDARICVGIQEIDEFLLGERLRKPQLLAGNQYGQRQAHTPYLVSISQPETSTTKTRLIGRNTFQPSRINWS